MYLYKINSHARICIHSLCRNVYNIILYIVVDSDSDRESTTEYFFLVHSERSTGKHLSILAKIIQTHVCIHTE